LAKKPDLEEVDDGVGEATTLDRAGDLPRSLGMERAERERRVEAPVDWAGEMGRPGVEAERPVWMAEGSGRVGAGAIDARCFGKADWF
jgi:hypothetical protein